MARNWLKWAPAVAIPVLIAGVAIVAPMAASAAVSLPAKSAQQILSLVANEKVTAFSGSLLQVSNLGLPALPMAGTGPNSMAEASAALALLTGSHSARVYSNGAAQLRVQLMDSLAERDFVRNATDAWLYDSKAHTAVHASLPVHGEGSAGPHWPESLTPAVHTPDQLVSRLLAAAGDSTSFSVGPDTRVAGRSAYALVLTPKATESLIGSVTVAVDSATGIPLSVAVTARGATDNAFSVAFTSLSLSAPDASLFSFTPPRGTSVSQQTVSTAHQRTSPDGQDHAIRQAEPADKPSFSGSGWASIVSIPSSASTAKLFSNALVSKLSSPVDNGRLFHTTLLNLLITTDGRIFVGSVAPAVLEAAAANN